MTLSIKAKQELAEKKKRRERALSLDTAPDLGTDELRQHHAVTVQFAVDGNSQTVKRAKVLNHPLELYYARNQLASSWDEEANQRHYGAGYVFRMLFEETIHGGVKSRDYGAPMGGGSSFVGWWLDGNYDKRKKYRELMASYRSKDMASIMVRVIGQGESMETWEAAHGYTPNKQYGIRVLRLSLEHAAVFLEEHQKSA